MNGYQLNDTFLLILEWGFVAVVIATILFTIWTMKHTPKFKNAFFWLAAHLVLTIIAHILFWMGLGEQSNSTTPIDNLIDQIHFLMGVAGLVWLMGMLCLILCIQVIKDTISAKKLNLKE